MEGKGVTFSSVIVPSVQEMVKEKVITTVLPPRYVRSDQEKGEAAIDSGENQIPIIDMSLLSSSTSMDSEIDKLDFACKEWGFFQASLKLLHYFCLSILLHKNSFRTKQFHVFVRVCVYNNPIWISNLYPCGMFL